WYKLLRFTRFTGLTAFNVFDEARSLGEHTDLIIRANDREFQVHKIILCGCSPYFRVLFSSNWTRIPEQFYDIPGMSRNIMSLIIQYAYTGSVFITEENVLELLVAADQFLVSGLVDACCQFLESRFCPENCIGICMFTEDFHSCSKLRHKAKLYILQHFEEVLQVSEEFLELSVEQLEEIIDKDELNVKQEEVVFEAVLHWIDHAPESRRKHIAMLLPKVRMGLMTSDYFINNVKSNALVMENEACMPLIINAMKALFEFDMDLHGPISLELIHQLTRPRLPSAILLAIGGWSNGSPSNVIEAYDANAGRWVNVTLEDERPRAYHGTAVLHEFVYSVGGYDSVEYFNSVRKLNLITQTWHEVAPMYERRCYVSVAVLDGFIYAIGGFDGHVRLKSTERYDPDTNQWTLTTSMNERRSDASATSLQVYAVGGFDGASRLRSAETYNPLTNIWCDTVVDDQLFAVGGFNGFSTTSDAECYDKKTNEWFDANEMAVFRSALNCCVISGLPNMAQYAAQRDRLTNEDNKSSQN
uniref:Kelch like family member 10 n=1 Tax=Sinocyclocheilus grahami TaxID=75366 RepID=A0A672S8D2_SINGR